MGAKGTAAALVAVGALVGLGGSVALAGSAGAATTDRPTTTSVTLSVLPGRDVEIPASTVVGLSWAAPAEAGTRVVVSVREGGAWGSAHTLRVAGTTGGRVSAEPLVARAATGVRVRFVTPSGRTPAAVRLVAVSAPAASADAGASPSASAGTGMTRSSVTAPTVITRAQWGADESRRTGAPTYGTAVRAGILQHTTGWTTYTQAEAYQFIRALYDWYTTPTADGGPGLSDIAYNVLIDRYGRVFEGRAGGLDRPVIGQHTRGFDRDTVGVAVMGDYEVNPLPADTADAIVTSISRVMAWKLGATDPRSSVQLTATAGGGSSRFAAGQVATVPAIAAESDLAITTSPGANLAARLVQIRARAAALMGLPASAPSFGRLAVTAATAEYRASAGATITAVTSRPMKWSVKITTPCSTATLRYLTGTQAFAGPLSVTWDLEDSLGIPVQPGRYGLSLRGTAADGGQSAPSASTSVVVTAGPGSNPGPCRNTPRTSGITAAATSVLLGRWAYPSAASAVLVPGSSAIDVGYQQVGAPLARAKRLPLLLTGGTRVPSQVMADLAARGVHSVLLVGPATRVAPSVVTQLNAAGITARRVSGVDLPATAAAVARLIGAPGSRGAVFVDPVALPAESALAAAAAARTGRPVLILAGRAVPAATTSVVSALGITGGAVVAPRFYASDASVAALKSARVWAADFQTLALLMAPSVTNAGERAVLIPFRSRIEASLAGSTGAPLLPVSGATLPDAITAWLDQRPSVTSVAAALPEGQVADAELTALSRALTDRPVSLFGLGRRGASAPVPSSGATAGAPAPVPPTFTVTGSGWGHGVGLSQAGAYGQAKEGRSAEEIVRHYYTGTEVVPINDSRNIVVALLHRVPSASLRTEAMQSGASGPVRVALAYGPTFVGTVADTFSFRYAGGRVAVSRTTAGVTTELGSATSVRVTWAGTRFARDLGRRPTLVNLVGPDDSFSDRQHRYRFGLIDVRPIAASSSGPAGLMVLNAVRLHDEYLYGIAEVNASWPLEALRAQVLASRSYAAAQMAAGIRKGCLCHSDDGGGPYFDQTFLGWVKVDEGSYSAAWRRAVDATAVTPPLGTATSGLAITYQGTVIAAYYTDSTGGKTRNVEDVWGGYAEPWARSVDDHWSLDPRNSPSFAQWRPRLRDQATLASMFGLPDVVSVEVTERAASGTAETVTATSSAGATATVSGRTFCRTLNLPSRWVWTVTPTA